MQLNINGEAVEVNGDKGRMLLWAIRNEAGLTGTKFGCGGGYCGACTVIVDGTATRSCITPVEQMEGKEIRTIDGLADMSEEDGQKILHPVQQAFLDNQVPQCSWCMSGQMMTATAFLEQTSNPSEDEVVEAMGNNYCRCGCYVRIKSAVIDAAQRMSTPQSETENG